MLTCQIISTLLENEKKINDTCCHATRYVTSKLISLPNNLFPPSRFAVQF